MKKVIIDTNCLLSFVSDRNLQQQEKISRLFKEAGRLNKLLLCHHHVLSEFVFVLHSIYSKDPDDINNMVSDLIAMPGVMPVTDVDMPTLLSLWPVVISDYGDAVIAAYCRKTKGTAIATFDRKFNKALSKANIPIYEL